METIIVKSQADERAALANAKKEFKKGLKENYDRCLAIQSGMVKRILNARVPSFGSISVKRLRVFNS